mmetsp:Transcript_2799/g.5065  ORF Transcript_2799/g.5065 Transcript_2799/m.5065 type:complete len:251 (+) Transcript_2799:55-807(+)
MMKTLTILLAASAILAPTSIAAHLASDPSDPIKGTINVAKRNVHRPRRRRNKSISTKSSKKGSDVERHDTKENTMQDQEEENAEATFNKYSPGEGTDTVMTMDEDLSMPAVDELGLELPSEFGRMSMHFDALEMAPVTLNGMSMEFPAMSMDFTEPPFRADTENGSTTAATMAASSGGTITTTKASNASKMLPTSPSDIIMTTSTIASIEEEEPGGIIMIDGVENFPSSSSMKSPILIASLVVGALFVMW